MANSTVYDVTLKYGMNDVASKGAKVLEANVDKVAKKSANAELGLKRVAQAAIGFFGAKAAYGAFIGYNRNLELSVTSLATTMFGFGVTNNFEDAMKRGTRLVEEYTQVAKTSVGETKDFVTMHQSLQGALLGTGLSMRDIKDVTIGATVASQVMGEQAEMTALDIKQMAMGTMTARDRVGGMLAGMYGTAKGLKGFGFAEWNKEIDKLKKKGDSVGIQKMLTDAVNSPALKAAADKMGNTFEGRLSTMKDNFSLIMAKAGKPLFEAVTKALEKINAWADKNADKIAAFVKDVGSALVSAFNFVSSAVGLIVEYKDPIIEIAKVWIVAATAMKAAAMAQAAAGFLGGVGGAGALLGGGAAAGAMSVPGAGLLAASGYAGWKIGGKIRDMEGSGGNTIGDNIGGLLGAFVQGEGTAGLAKWKELRRQERRFQQQINKSQEWQAQQSGLLATEVARQLQEVKLSGSAMSAMFGKAGLLQAGIGGLDVAQAGGKSTYEKILASLPQEMVDTIPKEQIRETMAQAYRDLVNTQGGGWDIASNASILGNAVAKRLGEANPELAASIKEGAKGKNATGAPKITIQKIEVESNDPDRFVFGLEAIARDAAVNVSQAKGAFRNG